MASVRRLIHDCISHALILQRPQAIVAIEPLHRSAHRSVEALGTRARAEGFSEAHIRMLQYALAALLDEIARQRSGAAAEYWEEHLLQQHFFHEVRAGEGFFTNLEQLLVAPRDDERALDVLEVHAICLYLGFRGKFAARADTVGRFDELLRRVSARLSDRVKGGDLGPPAAASWSAPTEITRLPLWIGGLALLTAFTLTCSYRARLLDNTADVVQLLERGQP